MLPAKNIKNHISGAVFPSFTVTAAQQILSAFNRSKYTTADHIKSSFPLLLQYRNRACITAVSALPAVIQKANTADEFSAVFFVF